MAAHGSPNRGAPRRTKWDTTVSTRLADLHREILAMTVFCGTSERQQGGERKRKHTVVGKRDATVLRRRDAEGQRQSAGDTGKSHWQ